MCIPVYTCIHILLILFDYFPEFENVKITYLPEELKHIYSYIYATHQIYWNTNSGILKQFLDNNLIFSN